MGDSRTTPPVPSFLRKLPIKFLLVALLFIVAVMIFGFIVREAVYKQGLGFDNMIIGLFAPYSREPFIGAMKFFTFFGSGAFLIPGYLFIIIYYLVKRQKVLAIHVAIIAITSYVLSQAAKEFFQRQRPDDPVLELKTTFSFPSSHAFSSFVFCGVLVYLVWRSNLASFWRWFLSLLIIFFALMIGISRLILRMHYPTDVLGGMCLGFIWVTLSFYVLNRIQRKPATSL